MTAPYSPALRAEGRSRHAEASPQNKEEVELGVGIFQAIAFQQMRNADNTNQATEIFYPAVTQVNFPIDVGQHRIDGTFIGSCDACQNIPIDVLQPQARCQTIEPNRFRVRLRQRHIEILDKRIMAYFHLPL
ncbi:hypothetical protein NZ708_07930 [Pseudomonas syringae pv. actinidiae ICMP 18708]|uniref:Glycosyl transferase n=1 Tax=Pseudomonas syringae pv. actinidiae TaxID=103796 RepID=A0A2V0QST1_PSESF|nr:hypothetical protein IYO_007940 [Pseudomonas syringae pv. actinidiae ICMP 18884]AOE55933.1 hypothetical protein NZ708_07930 [Pseudomonas syringae pv. actinidiae ICMP 18708]APP96793.1 hypothetical protein PsaNZ45_07930 [Pseudomonas syringae pv. actinidiae]KTC47838.1 hypothetical protein AO250_07730 [Pseudomonas syringae pv. actinidiae ICMP 19497]APQ02648.1 hypothetical protein PsaNZ47_07925 [Pseudomonas syringae pv. actinidiae]